MLTTYEKSLTYVLRHRFATLVLSILILGSTLYLFLMIPKGFLPSEDTGQIFGFTEAAQGISFEAMSRHQQDLAAIIGQDPNVDSFMSGIGASGVSVAPNTGRVFIRLKPHNQRRMNVDEIIQSLRPKLDAVPGIQAFLQNVPPIRIGGLLTKSQYQFTLQSPDTEALYRYAPILEARLRQLPGL
jgi:HAE1 family hydrophobic/amphiphilic exporter-1